VQLTKVKTISRTDDPSKANWEPIQNERGYQLVSRTIPYPQRNLVASATFVATLDEAWDLISKHDFGIRMGVPGAHRGNYIYPKDLKAVW
jgi:hypothetical protein